MSALPLSTTRPRQTALASVLAIAIAFAVTFVAIVILFKGDLHKVAGYAAWVGSAYSRPHWPDLGPLLGAGPVIQAHVITVLAALMIGTILMIGVKGTMAHRVLGWAWVSFMLVTATISFFVREIGDGKLSFIHIFSALVLIQAPLGLYLARDHKVDGHRKTMSGLYFGALLVAGFFTFLPGRIMYHVFFG